MPRTWPPGAVDGLGLLDVVTVMTPRKRLAEVQGVDRLSGAAVRGYEIHIGQTNGADCLRGWLDIEGRQHGAASADGHVRGCYIHGLFGADGFRSAYLASLGAEVSGMDFEAEVDSALEELADHVEAHMDLELIWALAGDMPDADVPEPRKAG